MGGIIGALVIGLVLVIVLLLNNNNSKVASVPPVIASNTVDPNATVAAAQPAPPRMPIEAFKALYDSPNKPLIIDVRAKASYDEGHIAGSESFPEADVDTRFKELPKDKLVIAYCQ